MNSQETPKLLHAHIVNFRSIKDAWLYFSPRCRALVGLNESGKSNVLKALALIDPARSPKPDDARDSLPDEPEQAAYIDFTFALPKDQVATRVAEFCESIVGVSEIRVTSKHGELVLADYLLTRNELIYRVSIPSGARTTVRWSVTANEKLLTSVFQKVTNAPNSGSLTLSDGSLRSFQGLRFTTKSPGQVIEDKFFKPIGLEEIVTAFTVEITPILEKSLPSCIFWEYSEKNILPAQIDLASFKGDPGSCVPLKRMFELASVTDIAAAITTAQAKPQGLRNLLSKVATAATKHLHAVWAESKTVSVDLSVNGGAIDATFKDSFNVYGMSRRSDGFKRFVTFLLHISASARTNNMVNTIYLHDEPDIGLHPRGARYLMNELIRISEHNYVVYSTHSIFMIDRESIERHLIISKDGEVTKLSVADEANYKNEEILFNALGTSIFEALKKSNVIFEGWRDRRLFEVFTNKAKVAADIKKDASERIGLCHVRGVKDIPSLAPILELGGRDYIVVSDSDPVGLEGKKQHTGKGEWLTYSDLSGRANGLTAEDFIAITCIVNAANLVAQELGINNELTDAEFAPALPNLKAVDGWLAKNHQSGDAKKRALDAIKHKIFDDLKVSAITPEYEAVARMIVSKFPVEKK